MQTVQFADGCQISHLKNKNLPMANKKFADYPVRNLPSASGTLADGKRFICRRQTENLQSASAPLAIGKIHV
ncbi:MAG TPA: hypothetical protein IAA30_08375 [Candidatus Treponema faecavium]|nr:hypothetical protein [Candidatus Treponema faecavium]